jgi:hypothetical protein
MNCKKVSQWLTPVILATQEAENGRIVVRSQAEEIVCKTIFHHRKGLAEWFKV